MTTSGSSRDDLVRAALAELEEGGTAAVSLRAVARRAGVSHAAPGYHFRDRSGLLTAVAAEGYRRLAAELDEPIPADGDPFSTLGKRYVAFALRHPALYDLMFRPAELDTADADLAEGRRASLRALTAVTATGPAPTIDTAVAWLFAHGTAMLAAQGALAAFPTATGPLQVDAVMDRFVASMRAP